MVPRLGIVLAVLLLVGGLPAGCGGRSVVFEASENSGGSGQMGSHGAVGGSAGHSADQSDTGTSSGTGGSGTGGSGSSRGGTSAEAPPADVARAACRPPARVGCQLPRTTRAGPRALSNRTAAPPRLASTTSARERAAACPRRSARSLPLTRRSTSVEPRLRRRLPERSSRLGERLRGYQRRGQSSCGWMGRFGFGAAGLSAAESWYVEPTWRRGVSA